MRRAEPGTQEIQVYDLVHLAHHYGVSRLAALFRLRNLRLVSQPEFDQLKAAEDAGRGRELASPGDQARHAACPPPHNGHAPSAVGSRHHRDRALAWTV